MSICLYRLYISPEQQSVLMQSPGQVRRVFGEQNCDHGTKGTLRASEPGLRETGENRVDRTRTGEELVRG